MATSPWVMVPDFRSRSAEPPMPLAGSTKPEAARSRSFTFMLASKGVLAESWGLIGPAFPDRLALPPPGKLTLNSKGNFEVAEKSVTSTLSLSYSCGLAVEFAFPTASFPFFISSFATDSAGASPDFAGSVACFALVPPRLEKFQTPFADLSNVICGWSRTISVTFNCLEKMRGINSTPTFTDFAVMNGDLLKAGSSAMLTSSTPTLPDKIERLNSPNVTGLPKAFVSSDSILGRKLLTLMNRGSAIKMTKMIAIAIPMIFIRRLLNCIFAPNFQIEIPLQRTQRWGRRVLL